MKTLSTKSSISAQKNRSKAAPRSLQVRWQVLAYAIAQIYLIQPAQAQITPAGQAGQRPVMDAAGNGVPIVNIAPPSAKGVSHNTYQDFNVGNQGAILNNSTGNTQTQLGGWIRGNPQLGNSARVIVNEVISANPSQLRGAIEIGGQRADLVIANPNGITCDGCGFINVNRGSLVTGSPQWDGRGGLNGFNVTSGTITVGNGGLDARQVEQLDLIARNIIVDGELWGNRVNVIAGANQVDYASLTASAQNVAGNGQRFAVDIRDMGGMYANHIWLVATEAGLGVNSSGRVAALQGNLQLSANGDLTVKDSYAKQAIQLSSSGNTTLTGQTVADGNLSVSATNLTNRGTVDVQGNASLQTASLTNRGTLIGRNSGGMRLDLAGNLDNDGGALISAGNLQINSGSLSNAGGQIQATTLGIQSGTLNNTRGTLASDGDLQLNSTAAINNTAGQIQSAAGTITSQSIGLDNRGGLLAAAGNLTINTGSELLNNTGGNLGGNVVQLTGNGLDNTRGAILADNRLTIGGGNLINAQGILASAGQINLNTAGGQLDNSAGQISGVTISLSGGNVINQSGLIQATQGDVNIDIQGHTLTNTDSGDEYGIVAARGITVRADSVNNHAGYLAGNADLNITATSINNGAGNMIGAAGFNLNAATLDNAANGNIASNGDLTVSADSITNAGLISSNSGLSITSTGIVGNSGTIIGNTGTTISANSLNNNGGNVLGNRGIILGTQNLINSGVIDAIGVLNVNSQQLQNDGGKLYGQQELVLTTGSTGTTTTLSGIVGSDNNVSLNITGDLLNAGKLTAPNILQVQADNITNAANGEIGAAYTKLVTAGTLSNAGLIDGSTTDITAGTLNNTGRIYGDLVFLQAGSIHNSGTGAIAARNTLLIGGSTLSNTSGAQIFSLGNAYIAGGFDADGSLTGSMTQLTNDGARIEAAGDLSIDSAQIANLNNALQLQTIAGQTTTSIQYRDTDGSLYSAEVNHCIGSPGQTISGCQVHPDKFGQRSTVPPVFIEVEDPCGHGDGDTCTVSQVVNFRDYTWNDPRFAQFGVPPVDREPPPSLPSSCFGENISSGDAAECQRQAGLHDAWQAHARPFYEALAVKVNAYNAEVTEDNRIAQGDDGMNHYTALITKTSTSSTEVIPGTYKPGEILSGGNMTLNGATTNNNSRIIAGQVLTINGPDIYNYGDRAGYHVSYEGSVQERYDRRSGGSGPSLTSRDNWVIEPHDTYTNLFAVERNLNETRGGEIGRVDTTAIGGNGASATGVSSINIDDNWSIRTQLPGLTVPSNSMFTLRTEPGQGYLIETDPRFTQYRSFLSSDYFLRSLDFDPERQLKRYGDGFYEQRLINDQIMALTGRRYLSGYNDTEAEYQALMESGVKFAQEYQLTPGVALSAEQMALLTSDMVWMVKQNVTLPDGSSQEVLVPQVYLRRPQAEDLQTNGSLIAARNVDLTARNNLINIGAIAGDTTSLFAGNDITNRGSISGQTIYARANNDLSNLSGRIIGAGNQSDITLSAGRDIVLATQTITASSSARTERTQLDTIATVQGGNIRVDAGRDISAQAADVAVSGTLTVVAGRDINIASVAEHNVSATISDGDSHTLQGRSNNYRDEINLNRASNFTAGGNTLIVAQGDLSVTGSNLHAGDNLTLQGSNVSIQAAKDMAAVDYQMVGLHDYTRHAQSDEVLSGGKVTAGNNLSIRATGVIESSGHGAIAEKVQGEGQKISGGNGQAGTGNINIAGAYLSAEKGSVGLQANNDIKLDAIKTNHSRTDESFQETSGFLVTNTTTKASFSQAERAEGTAVTGKNVILVAGDQDQKRGDITIAGSQIVADNNIAMAAGRNIDITSVAQEYSSDSMVQTTKSGMFGAGFGVTFGQQKQQQLRDTADTVNAGSTIASLNGNIGMSAGQDYRQTGSHIMALNQGQLDDQGNITVKAQHIDITAATDSNYEQNRTKFEQAGLTIAVSSPVLSAISAVQDFAKSQDDENSKPKDSRLQALSAATTALKLVNAGDEMMKSAGSTSSSSGGGEGGGEGGQGGGGSPSFSVSITVGGAKSDSKQENYGTTASGSSLSGAGNVNLIATGAGKDSHIRVVGSDIMAGKDLNLISDGTIDLLAAQNTAEQHSSNHSFSGGVGVAVSVSQGGASFGFTANASAARGKADGKDVTYTNSHATAGQTLNIVSGGDTNIIGAQVSGQRVVGDIGGDLNIASLQDTSVFKSDSLSAQGSVTIGYGFSASGSLSMGKMKSDYAAVSEQSGIYAGDDGFQIKVKGNTDLQGAVIASNQAAVDSGVNSLSTGTLTYRDIENHAEYSAVSISVGGGISRGSGGKAPGKGEIGMKSFSNGGSISPPGVMAAKGDEKSSTHSAISGGAITITDEAGQLARTGKTAEETIAGLNRDTDNAQNSLNQIFDRQEIESAFAITREFAKEAGTFVSNRAAEADAKRQEANNIKAGIAKGDYLEADIGDLQDRVAQLNQQADAIDANWGSGGTYRQIVSALVAGASGNVTGGMGDLAQSALVNYVQQQGASMIGDMVRNGDLKEGSPEHAALHAIVACAGAAASNGNCGAGAMGAAASSLVTNLLDDNPNKSNAQKEKDLNLIGTLVAGISVATGNADYASTATTAAMTAADNNYLTQSEAIRKAQLQKCVSGISPQCKDDKAARQKASDELKQLKAKDDERDQKLAQACSKPRSGECFAAYADLNLAKATYDTGKVDGLTALDIANDRMKVNDEEQMYRGKIEHPTANNTFTGVMNIIGAPLKAAKNVYELQQQADAGDLQAQKALDDMNSEMRWRAFMPGYGAVAIVKDLYHGAQDIGTNLGIAQIAEEHGNLDLAEQKRAEAGASIVSYLWMGKDIASISSGITKKAAGETMTLPESSWTVVEKNGAEFGYNSKTGLYDTPLNGNIVTKTGNEVATTTSNNSGKSVAGLIDNASSSSATGKASGEWLGGLIGENVSTTGTGTTKVIGYNTDNLARADQVFSLDHTGTSAIPDFSVNTPNADWWKMDAQGPSNDFKGLGNDISKLGEIGVSDRAYDWASVPIAGGRQGWVLPEMETGISNVRLAPDSRLSTATDTTPSVTFTELNDLYNRGFSTPGIQSYAEGYDLSLGLTSRPTDAYSLSNFTEAVDGRAYYLPDQPERSLFKYNPGDLATLENNLSFIINNADSINMNLTGVIADPSMAPNLVSLGQRGIDHIEATGAYDTFQVKGNVTNWEASQILTDPALRDKTTFYINGEVVQMPALPSQQIGWNGSSTTDNLIRADQVLEPHALPAPDAYPLNPNPNAGINTGRFNVTTEDVAKQMIWDQIGPQMLEDAGVKFDVTAYFGSHGDTQGTAATMKEIMAGKDVVPPGAAVVTLVPQGGLLGDDLLEYVMKGGNVSDVASLDVRLPGDQLPKSTMSGSDGAPGNAGSRVPGVTEDDISQTITNIIDSEPMLPYVLTNQGKEVSLRNVVQPDSGVCLWLTCQRNASNDPMPGDGFGFRTDGVVYLGEGDPPANMPVQTPLSTPELIRPRNLYPDGFTIEKSAVTDGGLETSYNTPSSKAITSETFRDLPANTTPVATTAEEAQDVTYLSWWRKTPDKAAADEQWRVAMEESNKITAKTQQVTQAQQRLGTDIEYVRADNTGTAKLRIDISDSIKHSDVKVLVDELKDRGAQKVEVDSGFISNSDLREFLERRVADGKPYMGGKVIRGENPDKTDFTIIF